jgi:hypothetical protein
MFDYQELLVPYGKWIFFKLTISNVTKPLIFQSHDVTSLLIHGLSSQHPSAVLCCGTTVTYKYILIDEIVLLLTIR